jgi:hypothetical protein
MNYHLPIISHLCCGFEILLENHSELLNQPLFFKHPPIHFTSIERLAENREYNNLGGLQNGRKVLPGV